MGVKVKKRIAGMRFAAHSILSDVCTAAKCFICEL